MEIGEAAERRCGDRYWHVVFEAGVEGDRRLGEAERVERAEEDSIVALRVYLVKAEEVVGRFEGLPMIVSIFDSENQFQHNCNLAGNNCGCLVELGRFNITL